jgi:hypothetical protein
MGTAGSNHKGLYAWETLASEMRFDEAMSVSDPAEVSRAEVSRAEVSKAEVSRAEASRAEASRAEVSRKVKAVARFFGASLVGICELDRRWLYSYVSNDITANDAGNA